MFYCKIFAVLRNSKLCNCLCLQSECQQLICDILRATPDAASADAAVQTARLASKAAPDAAKAVSEEGLSFAFRFTDTVLSLPGWFFPLLLQSMVLCLSDGRSYISKNYSFCN
jgi:hypothetical protein